jgi:long-chain acyl-CoA synthetase
MPAAVPFDTIPQLFSRLVRRYDGQQQPVLRHKERGRGWIDTTYEDLRRHVHAFAGYLYEQGVRPGDRVAVLAENRPEWAIADLAAQILGAVNVSIYTSLPPAKVAYILRDSGARVVVASVAIQRKKIETIFDDCPDLERAVVMSDLPDGPPAWMHGWDEALEAGRPHWDAHAGTLEALGQAVSPSDTSALIYTSGTTGEPKGVVLSHENFCSNAKAALDVVTFTEEDHHLSFLPLCHAFERTCGYTAVLASGATISYAESVEAVSSNLQEVRPTVMIAVPRMFERFYSLATKQVSEGSAIAKRVFSAAVWMGKRRAQAEHNGGPNPLLRLGQRVAHTLVFEKLHAKLGGRLRFAVSGGAALPKEIGEFFQAAGITIVEGYGLTETAPILCVNPLERPRYGTVGHVIPGVTVGIQRVRDGQTMGAQHGSQYPSTLSTEEGEIVAKGPNVMRAYWNRPEETRAAFDTDGWYHTGDIGRFDGGYLQVTDRLKHMIVSRGGKNIYPGPLEDAFKTKPLFDQIMVVGEGKPFLTALVVPDFDVVRMHARDQGLVEKGLDEEALVEEKAIQTLFDKTFRTYNRDAASHEKIRDFVLLTTPFSIENGQLTPTLKLKRSVIEEAYAEQIEAMYAKYA